MTSSDDDRTGGLQRDIERVEALRDQGRLSEEEAHRLIAVLRGEAPDDEPDAEPGAPDDRAAAAAPARRAAAVDDDIDGALSEAGEAVDEALRAVADETGRAASAGAFVTASSAEGARATTEAPADDLGITWLLAEMLAAELVVESVAGATEPRLRTPVDDAVLEHHGDGWRLRYRSDRSSWTFFGLDRTLERIELELPVGMGVELAVKAGDVRLQGVTHVRGRMLAGDLLIDGASFVDVDKKAGDLEVRMRPTSGSQRVIAKAGDVDVTLLDGSDVRVAADVKVGDLRVDGALLQQERSSKGVGHRYVGTVGAGSAELTVRLTAGSLRLRS
jgi:hypothetical protein